MDMFLWSLKRYIRRQLAIQTVAISRFIGPSQTRSILKYRRKSK